MDDSGDLFVADRENSRVTRYDIDAAPNVVIDPLTDPILIGGFNAADRLGVHTRVGRRPLRVHLDRPREIRPLFRRSR